MTTNTNLYSPHGVRIVAAQRDYATGRFACFMQSSGQPVFFFECFAVVDDFGNLVTVGE